MLCYINIYIMNGFPLEQWDFHLCILQIEVAQPLGHIWEAEEKGGIYSVG